MATLTTSLALSEPSVAVYEIYPLCGNPVIMVSIANVSGTLIGDVHESRKGHCYAANVNQIAEQAILAKNALSLAEYTGHDSSSGNGVEFRHKVRDLEVLDTSQQVL
jgi:hypothetical protein